MLSNFIYKVAPVQFKFPLINPLRFSGDWEGIRPDFPGKVTSKR